MVEIYRPRRSVPVPDLTWEEKRRRLREAGERAVVGLRQLREAIERDFGPAAVSSAGPEVDRDA